MTVTELRPEGGGTSTEGLAAAEKASAEAEAMRIKNESDRRRAKLADEKAAAKAQADIESSLADAADERRRRDEARREVAARKAKAEKSAEQWRRAAKTIAIVCVIVSLPLQIMAFWDPTAWFLVAAPFVLEGVAWALLKGAEAAVDDGRPSWHYRLGALAQASIAAWINFDHGSAAFGTATGLGGALCSLIGPTIWDLHENGRIAKREGRKTWSQRWTERREARAEQVKTKKLIAARIEQDETVWERAVYLAAALGELTPSDRTYRRAWDEIHGTDPGQTAEIIAARRAARRAVRIASNGPLKDENTQLDSQMDPDDERPSKAPKKSGEDGRKNNGGTPPRRVPGEVKYSAAARTEMSNEGRRRAASKTDA
ncbi:hypothetical protein [Streptomyces sp. R33]|uniref:DUF2637 domain-containing protein n=1 Tax=Streptomyces sp. R33 TaxID=3238629 RepID=A0AB39Y6D5_9ACTN